MKIDKKNNHAILVILAHLELQRHNSNNRWCRKNTPYYTAKSGLKCTPTGYIATQNACTVDKPRSFYWHCWQDGPQPRKFSSFSPILCAL